MPFIQRLNNAYLNNRPVDRKRPSYGISLHKEYVKKVIEFSFLFLQTLKFSNCRKASRMIPLKLLVTFRPVFTCARSLSYVVFFLPSACLKAFVL
jgi:hypothetical protein